MKSAIDFHLALMEFMPRLYRVERAMRGAVDHSSDALSILCDTWRGVSSLEIKFPCFSSVDALQLLSSRIGKGCFSAEARRGWSAV